jgi:hypothetical protein
LLAKTVLFLHAVPKEKNESDYRDFPRRAHSRLLFHHQFWWPMKLVEVVSGAMTNKISFDNFAGPYIVIPILIFLIGVALYFFGN